MTSTVQVEKGQKWPVGRSQVCPNIRLSSLAKFQDNLGIQRFSWYTKIFLRRTFWSISSCQTFCPARIYPFAGHLKFSPDMSGETGGFNVLWTYDFYLLPSGCPTTIQMCPGNIHEQWMSRWAVKCWDNQEICKFKISSTKINLIHLGV